MLCDAIDGATVRHFLALRLTAVLMLLWNFAAFAQTTTTPTILHVGPGQQYPTIAAASKAAKDGDIVEIEAAQYIGDVALWLQTRLTIRGVHGRPQLVANGVSMEGKGIWVIRNGNFTVENIEFTGSRVPDRNGVGIRFENGSLVVRNCVFKYNEGGILTGNNPASALTVENSEFGPNGYGGDGHVQHNLYVGQIGKFSVSGSYFHHAKVGHLLKSRAKESYVFNNRLTDENGGTAGYELEFPNGGLAYVVGNIIQQSPLSANSTMVSYGAEGYFWPQNQIYLVNNTLINDKTSGGTFLRAASGVQAIEADNNLLIGVGSSLDTAGTGRYLANFKATASDFMAASAFDFRLNPASPLLGKAVDPGAPNNVPLRPTREYVHPLQTRLIPKSVPFSPGAEQTPGP